MGPYRFFTDHGETLPIPENERRKLALRQIYYAQFRHFEAEGAFTADLSRLDCPIPAYPVTAEVTSRSFVLTCPAEKGGTVVLQSDGFTYVEEANV